MPAEIASAVDYLVAEYELDPAAAAEQVKFSAAMEERVPRISSALGDSYAGAWVDNSNPGALFVASTLPEQAANRLQDLGIAAAVREATYSQAELSEGSDRLWDTLNESNQDASEIGSGFRISIDIQENELDLEMAPDYPLTPALKDTIDNFVPHVEIKPTESWEPSVGEDCPGRFDCVPDLRGGLYLFDHESAPPGNDDCTSGYSMVRNGVRYVSTAGHCHASGAWEHHDTKIGFTWTSLDGGHVDFQAIDITNRAFWNARAWVFRPAIHATPVTTKIHDPSASLEGVTLSISGFNGQLSGELIDWSSTLENNTQQGKTNYNACPGDSGAPVFNYYNDRAYGMHNGGTQGCVASGFSYFTWTANIEAATPYTVAYYQ